MVARSLFLSLLPPLLWAVVVAAALLAPGSLSESSSAWAAWFAVRGVDKVGHAVLFFIQAFLLGRFLEGRSTLGRARWAAGAAALYGLVLEVAQLVVPGRGFDALDIVANASGAALWLLWLGRRSAS